MKCSRGGHVWFTMRQGMSIPDYVNLMSLATHPGRHQEACLQGCIRSQASRSIADKCQGSEHVQTRLYKSSIIFRREMYKSGDEVLRRPGSKTTTAPRTPIGGLKKCSGHWRGSLTPRVFSDPR